MSNHYGINRIVRLLNVNALIKAIALVGLARAAIFGAAGVAK
jgi:hypothetical protein